MEETREEMVRATNEATYRTWRLYMAASAFGFRTGRSSIHQSLLAKPDRGRAGLPLTREWLYK
jgi:cyclopropane-fatty-acyl-phospholipid synthase